MKIVVDLADDMTMDVRQKRLLNDARRMRQRAVARGDVRAVHACNRTIAALRRESRPDAR